MADEHGHGHHGHGHGHGGHEGGYNADSLRNNDRLYRDVYREILGWLAIPDDASVLEAGSGAGGFTAQMAHAIGHRGGKVTALDADQELLDAAREHISQTEHKDDVTFKHGDMSALPFDDGVFDLVWSSRAVHHVDDQLAAVQELSRVVKPGGRLVLREGNVGTRVLPDDIGIGTPGLEERLDMAWHQWFWAGVRSTGVRYPFGFTHMLAEAGLTDVTAMTFMMEALPPFSDPQIS